jgi:hypothetical protein
LQGERIPAVVTALNPYLYAANMPLCQVVPSTQITAVK